MSIGWTIVAVFGFLFALFVHEAAHAVALRNMGGRITKAGLGLPLPPMLTLKPTKRRSFALTLSPWLIAAYVEPDDESEQMMQGRRYLDKAWFAAAGVIINAITGFLLAAVFYAYYGSWRSAGIAVGLAVVFWFARRLIAAIVPLIGIAAIVLIAQGLSRTVGEAQGPVGTAQLIVSDSGIQALGITVAISFALAILNCVPIFPFDGGRVTTAALEARFSEKVVDNYQVVTSIITLAFLVYVIGSDVWSLAT